MDEKLSVFVFEVVTEFCGEIVVWASSEAHARELIKRDEANAPHLHFDEYVQLRRVYTEPGVITHSVC